MLGQVTRVYPLSSEVTLLVDKDAAIPVLNPRTQHRSAAFGNGSVADAMELRFMAGNDDVQVGDVLTTSGVDGVYPPGLQVARVTKVDRRADSAFARIALLPTAQPDGVRHVLVLEPMACSSCPPGLSRPPRPRLRHAALLPASAGHDAPPVRPRRRRRPMIMPRGSDQLLLPVNPLFLWLTLLIAFASTWCRWAASRPCPTSWPWCWCSGMCTSPAAWAWALRFVFGLLMDVHEGALLGQHALAYTLLSFIAISMHRRLLWFGVAGAGAARLAPVFCRPPGLAAGAVDRRRAYLPGLEPGAGALLRGPALAGGGLAAAGAAAPPARPGQEPAFVIRRQARRTSRQRLHAESQAGPHPLPSEGRHQSAGPLKPEPLARAVDRFRLRILCGVAAFFVLRLQPARPRGWSTCRWCAMTSSPTRAEANRIAVVPIVPNRGRIVDRNGVVLATNYTAYTLEITPSKAGDLEKTIDSLGQILDISGAGPAALQAPARRKQELRVPAHPQPADR